MARSTSLRDEKWVQLRELNWKVLIVVVRSPPSSKDARGK